MSRIEQALQKVAGNQSVDNKNNQPAETSSAKEGVSTRKSAPIREHHSEQPKEQSLEISSKTAPLNVNNPMLLTSMRGDRSPVAEEYNKLRSLVVKLTKGETFLNTIMITSTIGEEGKSLTSLNLAIALAREYDHTVLLVDADLRRPSLHKQLGIDSKPGLIQCLKENYPLHKALVKTGFGKLVFLPSGGTLGDPVETLSSNRMKELVAELKNRYPERYVIFDTPPSLPFADAQVLAPTVDSTIFVVRECKAKAKDVEETINSLQGNNLLGVVYNDAKTNARKKHYYYY